MVAIFSYTPLSNGSRTLDFLHVPSLSVQDGPVRLHPLKGQSFDPHLANQSIVSQVIGSEMGM